MPCWSMMVKELAMCTRPMILAVPRPLATPAKHVSTSRIILHLMAHSLLMRVLCAPLSTKALILWPSIAVEQRQVVGEEGLGDLVSV